MNEIPDLLRKTFPVPAAELRQDLWPRMLRRLEQPPARLGWFDWALIGASSAWLVAFPQALPVLFYHL